MRGLLAARAIFFVIVLPGTVTIYLPYLILRDGGQVHLPVVSFQSVMAVLLLFIGATVLLSCVWEFAVSGRGTLAPIDPPRNLVVTGLYRFTRNPMYNGVLIALLGEAWLFSSFALLQYAAIVFIFFHLFVILYEEPVLKSMFGQSYLAYREAVPRWGFTVHPYPTHPRGTA